MSLCLHFKEEAVEVVVWRMNENLSEILALLSHDSQPLWEECSTRFPHSEHRQMEWFSVRLALKEIFGNVPRVAYRENGEPFLADRPGYISFSHTRGYAAVAFHPFRHVGVDIEHFSHRVDALVKRILHPSEFPLGSAGAAPISTWYALLAWSMKESAYKCLDLSFLDYQNGLRLVPFMISSEITGKSLMHYCHKGFRYPVRLSYHCASDYVLTWCFL